VCWPVQKIMRGKFVYVCELAMKGKRERRKDRKKRGKFVYVCELAMKRKVCVCVLWYGSE
jgi:predicted SprT family Zn-dependent metalloprotease